MPLRDGISFAVCFAVLIGSTLGLNRGMVLCIDGDGHYALESAHIQHAECHEEGTDHLPHEFSSDAEHAELHAGLETCFDAAVGSVHLRSAKTPLLRPCDFPPAPYVILPNHALLLSSSGLCSGTDAASSPPLRPEIACLSAIVLLV